jgi:hypothetical protein
VTGHSSIARDRGIPAAGHEVFRLTTPVALWWGWVAFAVANVVDLAVQGSPSHSALVIDAIVLLVTGLAYALALRPRVIADQAGLTIVNPFRDHRPALAVFAASARRKSTRWRASRPRQSTSPPSRPPRRSPSASTPGRRRNEAGPVRLTPGRLTPGRLTPGRSALASPDGRAR